MSRRLVLLVCYYFPPMGGAGVARPLALVRHLPEFGYECHVLTVKDVAYRIYEPELLEGLPDHRIYRARSVDPQRLMYLLGMRLMRGATVEKGRTILRRHFPDAKKGWIRGAVKLGRTLLTNRDYHAVLSTSPPVSAHLVAQTLAREFNRPWLADFRDYWAGTVHTPEVFYHDRPRRLRQAKDLLARIRERATALTAVNAGVADYVGAGRVIPNSYDVALNALWTLPEERGNFVVGVLGTINDVTPIEPLFRVLAELREASPDLFEHIRVLHVGDIDPARLETLVSEYRLQGRVRSMGLRGRAGTIRLLSQSSLMYLGVASRREAGLSTGRIYTMLASGRPLLAHAPDGSEIDRLIADTGAGHVFFEKGGEAVRYLRSQVQSWAEGSLDMAPNPPYASPYSSRVMAEKFARVLDGFAPPPDR